MSTEGSSFRDLAQDWFCRCCKVAYKRENPTMIRGEEETFYYTTFGMCSRCFKEANPEEVRSVAHPYEAAKEQAKDSGSTESG